MRKHILLLALTVTLFSLVTLYYQNEKYKNSFLTVNIHEVTIGNLSSIVRCSGRIEEVRREEIVVDPTFTIREWKVKVGDQVKKDQLLATVNIQDMTYQLEQARLSREICEINLDLLKKQYTAAKRAQQDFSVPVSGSSGAFFSGSSLSLNGIMPQNNMTQNGFAGNPYPAYGYSGLSANGFASGTTGTNVQTGQSVDSSLSSEADLAQYAGLLEKYGISEAEARELLSRYGVSIGSSAIQSQLSGVADNSTQAANRQILQSGMGTSLMVTSQYGLSQNNISSADLTGQANITEAAALAQSAVMLSNLESAIAITEKQLEMAKLHVMEIEKLIAKQREGIRSPIDGIVTEIEGGSGSYQRQARIVVSNLDELVVKANVNEFDAVKLKPGQKAIITGESVGREITGEVISVAPVARQLQLSYGSSDAVVEVVISIDDPAGIKPGFAVDCEIVYGYKENVLSIPYDAIIQTREGKKTVYVAVGNRAFQREIETGLESEMDLEVVKGLKEGDLVIVNSPIDIRDGSLIKIN